tara:strand:+ start:1512 stop:3380 length:1869 start_codon:yes stop_codon:yes gene_type:complete
MCGLAFYLGRKSLNNEILEETAKSLSKRGPDRQRITTIQKNGYYCHLIHTRLAIIDSNNEEASQPFYSSGYYLIFNGEIYNYKEIQKDLIRRGHKFKTESDTEVLLKFIYEHKGKNLGALEGMWSFIAIKDDLTHWISSRDIFSEKPLFRYQSMDGSIFFGSTPMQIRLLLKGSEELKIDKNFIKRYIYLGHRGLYTSGDCIFQNVKRIRGNSVLFESLNGPLEEINIVDIPSKENHKKTALRDHDKREIIDSSICNSFIKDNSINAACMLSGGIDSNLVYSLWRKYKKDRLKTYTLKISDKRYDESDTIKKIVDSSSSKHEHKFINIDKKLSYKWLDKITNDNLDFLSSITSIAYAHIANQVSAEANKVIINGTGGDELFAGYLVHHLYFLAELKKSKSPNYDEELELWEKNINVYIRNEELKDPILFASMHPDGFWLDNNQEINFFKNRKELNYFVENSFPKINFCSDTGILWKSLMNDLFISQVPPQTIPNDYISMFFSLENRAPILSQSILNLMKEMPLTNFINKGKTKNIIRENYKDIIPSEVINSNNKIGFNADIFELFDEKQIVNTLNEAKNNFLIKDCVDIEFLKERIKNKEITNGISKLIFRILSVEVLSRSL